MTRAEIETRLARRAARDPVLRTVCAASRETGVDVWIVGGYVRDTVLGRKAVDVDLAAGRPAARLIAALRAAWARSGFRFRKRGVTTWRFRVGGRDVDVVDAGGRGIDRDLLRRELTVNAIAFHPASGRLHDPASGLRDLRSGRLRLPRPGVIREDPVRALRIARFVAQLPGFRPSREAASEAAGAARGLRRCSPERVRDELDALLAASGVADGLHTLDRLGLTAAVLPELEPLGRCVAGRDRPDVWRHTIDCLAASARAARLPGAASLSDPASRLVLRWALLLHDIAKPDTLDTAPDGRPTFHGHEVLGARRAEAVLARLRQPRELRRRVRRLVLFHLRPHHLADAGAPARGMRRLVREAGGDLPVLLVLAACDARASGSPDAASRWRRLRGVLRNLEALHGELAAMPTPALIGGRDVIDVLAIPPGPEVGAVLRRARERQDEGRLRTRDEALAWLRGLRRRRPRGRARPGPAQSRRGRR